MKLSENYIYLLSCPYCGDMKRITDKNTVCNCGGTSAQLNFSKSHIKISGAGKIYYIPNLKRNNSTAVLFKLDDKFLSRETTKETVKDIIKYVLKYYNISEKEFRSKSRRQVLYDARVLIALRLLSLGMSKDDISLYIYRDRTTIIYYEKISKNINEIRRKYYELFKNYP